MKKKTKLLLMALSLTLAALIAWGTTVYYAPDNRPKPMTQGQLIFALSGDSLRWQQRGCESICFDISGEEWVLEGDPDYRLGAMYQADIEKQLTQLRSQKCITDPGDLAQYGLADPSATIWTDTATLYLGDCTAVSGQRYLYIQGQEVVYLVSETALYPFSYTLEDMMQMPSLPAVSQAVSLSMGSLTLTRDDQDNWLLDGAAVPESQTLNSTLKKLRLLDCAFVVAPEDAAAQYQLETVLTFTLEDGSQFTLTLGKLSKLGMYASIGDGRLYYVSPTLFDTLNQLMTPQP